MTEICRPAKCVEAIRVTLLDQCTLLPVCGPLNGYAMGCIIDPDWSPEIEEGEESTVKDNCGDICFEDQRCDRNKRWNVSFKIKGPDAEFLSLISGDPLIVDGDGNSVGVRSVTFSCSPYVFLELFERTDDCGADGDPIYLRHLLPAVRLKQTGNEREGVFRILALEGKSRSVVTTDIGTGPYDDIPAYVTTAPAGERIDYTWFEDTVIPAVQCGAIEVPCPPSAPTVESAASQDCGNIQIVGTQFDLVNHIIVNGPPSPPSYYDPAGPDAGLNPVTATINSWTPTLIDITDTLASSGLSLAYHTPTDVQMLGVGDVPDYGIFDFPDFTVNSPTVLTANQTAPGEDLLLTGTCFDLPVQGMVVVSTAGTITFTPADLVIDSPTTAHITAGALAANGFFPSTVTAVKPDNHAAPFQWTGSLAIS